MNVKDRFVQSAQGAAKLRSLICTIGERKNKKIVKKSRLFFNFANRGPDLCPTRYIYNFLLYVLITKWVYYDVTEILPVYNDGYRINLHQAIRFALWTKYSKMYLKSS